VQWVIDDNKESSTKQANILDVGTGSGCIPISLKLALPGAHITSCDISAGALKVAEANAQKLSAVIEFIELDFLDMHQRRRLGVFDVVISNPPYIPLSDRGSMHANVKDYEPSTALFVPDNDALLFYKAIAVFGLDYLRRGGYIYCELDAGHALDAQKLFENCGYKHVELKKDMHGNWRMLKAVKGL